MQATLEERVTMLEAEISELKRERKQWMLPTRKDWRSTFGWAKNAPDFDRAMDAGEAYRREQTFEKESDAAA
ncbi:MAG TPA: hypothetical protein PLB55_09275 [Prosthecobacter sp.]|jgi:nicotinamide mononucleotide adenylyltransferase|nr:hypothetical protein [Prosthecobacter sp.]